VISFVVIICDDIKYLSQRDLEIPVSKFFIRLALFHQIEDIADQQNVCGGLTISWGSVPSSPWICQKKTI